MKNSNSKGYLNLLLFGFFALALSACASDVDTSDSSASDLNIQNADNATIPIEDDTPPPVPNHTDSSGFLDDATISATDYTARLPQNYNTHHKNVILIDPKVHAWGAYDNDGNLVKAGLAACGGDFCKDTGRPCHTAVGTFKVRSEADADCVSSKYPKPNGGGPMPYALFFHDSMAIHGSPEIMDANISHGCVRIPVTDAQWLRYNFAHVGTTVIVRPY